MGKVQLRSVFCGKLFYPLALTCFIFVAFQFYLFLIIGNMRSDYSLVSNASVNSKNSGVKRRQVSNSKMLAKGLEERNDQPTCAEHSKETMSALKRAKTNDCKELILRTSCLHQHLQLFPTHLKRTCPNSASSFGKALGCYRDSSKRRLLPDHMSEFKDVNSPGHCVNHCLRLGFSYAGVEYSKECHCALNIPTNISSLSLPQHLCDSRCPNNFTQTCGGYYAVDVYRTGFSKVYNNASYVSTLGSQESKVKVLFMLTLTGRGLRQVMRLLKTIYRPHHFYLIHVDQRQEYLHRELEELASRFGNIRMAKRRFSTIWGGASLLEMLLSCMVEALEPSHGWPWDYFINLSESDYPIKTIEELESFLTKNAGKNFLKSHGKNTARFIQRQGLDMLFLECENRMWRLGPRSLQSGINIDGGSDWIGLHRSFVIYLTSGSDQLLDGLKAYWKYSLLPAESFFHTVLQNSRFCLSLVNNNLHLTNWRRKQGCHCQYKHVVDWCGCSPNDYRLSDFTKLQSTKSSPEFFARKFEAIVNQDIINLVDEHLLRMRTLGQPSADSFWLNIWNSKDEQANDLLLTFFSSLARTIHSRCSFGAPLRILDAHVFKRLEKIEGVVLTVKMVETEVTRANDNKRSNQSAVAAKRKTSGVMEAMFSPTNHNYDFMRKRKPYERITHVEVGTDFDPKEEIFRNYLSIFGPHAELVVSLHVVPDQEAEGSLAIQLVDPQANVAYTSSFTAAKGVSIVTHTPRLEKPLRPGVWMVKTRESAVDANNETWTIQTKFLILPLSHRQGRLIVEREAALTNHGPPYEADDGSRSIPGDNRSPVGRDLDEWIDQLLASFWNQASSCLAVPLPEAGRTSLCRVLPPCAETYWSTLYPDPKSAFAPPSENDDDGGFR